MFNVKVCKHCNELKLITEFTFASGYYKPNCKPCEVLKDREWRAKNQAARKAIVSKHLDKKAASTDKMYEDWVAALPPFKPMTELEWHKACDYFGGCALCSHPHIEARQFFIQPEHGGQYTMHNVFPTCAKCSAVRRELENPFAWLKGLAYNSNSELNLKREQRLLEYLKSKVGEAYGKQGEGI